VKLPSEYDDTVTEVTASQDMGVSLN
jgi:hypothetical protein